MNNRLPVERVAIERWDFNGVRAVTSTVPQNLPKKIGIKVETELVTPYPPHGLRIHRKTLRHCTSVTETFDDNMSKRNIQVDKLPLPSDHLMTTAGTTAGDILLRVLWVVSFITIPWPARCNCLSGWFESGMLNCKRVPRGLLYYQTL